ncbi:MAG: hypothetical protein LWW86_10930 [Micrococcales bacterium]|nr:hypothetical protein [Micrococcales bacterium]
MQEPKDTTPATRQADPAMSPLARRLATLPPIVPALVVLGLLLLGAFVRPLGWVFTSLVALFLVWMLTLSWGRLTPVERLMRVAVLVLVVAVAVTQAIPR